MCRRSGQKGARKVSRLPIEIRLLFVFVPKLVVFSVACGNLARCCCHILLDTCWFLCRNGLWCCAIVLDRLVLELQ